MLTRLRVLRDIIRLSPAGRLPPVTVCNTRLPVLPKRSLFIAAAAAAASAASCIMHHDQEAKEAKLAAEKTEVGGSSFAGVVSGMGFYPELGSAGAAEEQSGAKAGAGPGLASGGGGSAGGAWGRPAASPAVGGGGSRGAWGASVPLSAAGSSGRGAGGLVDADDEEASLHAAPPRHDYSLASALDVAAIADAAANASASGSKKGRRKGRNKGVRLL